MRQLPQSWRTPAFWSVPGAHSLDRQPVTQARATGSIPPRLEHLVAAPDQITYEEGTIRESDSQSIARVSLRVRTAGVEPAPLTGQDPKSCASASSATFA